MSKWYEGINSRGIEVVLNTKIKEWEDQSKEVELEDEIYNLEAQLEDRFAVVRSKFNNKRLRMMRELIQRVLDIASGTKRENKELKKEIKRLDNEVGTIRDDTIKTIMTRLTSMEGLLSNVNNNPPKNLISKILGHGRT